MKIRSFLLVACMVVVPLIAMFSHRIPSGTRAAVMSFLRELGGPRPTATTVVAIDAGAATPAAPPPARPAVVQAAPTSDAVNRTAAAEVPVAVSPRVVPVAAAAPEPDAFGSLRALGAVTIECRPLAGGAGHVASCRVPVDGSGQLERVFQATGADVSTAAENLLRDVTAWQAATTAAGPTRVRRQGTMRF